ncbi:MAG: hypothetical protein EOO74_10820, partial [Myxococcales bacterium]
MNLQAPYVPAQINGTVLLDLYEGVAAVHGDDYTLIRNSASSSTSTSDFVQGVAGTSTSNSSQVGHAGWAPASSATIGFVSYDTTQSYFNSFTTEPYFNNTDRTQNQTVSFNQYVRRLESTPAASAGTGGQVLASPLLASRPGASNGVVVDGPFVPPVVTPPANPPTGGPAATGELPPPQYFVPTRAPAGFEVAKSPMTVSADAVKGGRSQAEIDAEILKDAGNFVREYMGEPAARKFEALTNAEDRAPFMNEVVYAMAVGKELYDATRDMGQDMRGALFSGWAGVQMWGLEEEKGFSDGLHRALTEKKKATPNEDGSPGTDRTRLQIPLDVLELELKQAKTEEEKTRIGRRVLRELVNAARDEAGQEVDDTADLELPDGEGGTVRI